MQTVTVEKNELLKILRENRKTHIQLYKEAVEGWKTDAMDQYQTAIKVLEDENKVTTHFDLQKPESHVKDYDRVIRMLEMSVDDEIELSSHEFEQYVQDEWGWKDLFVTSNAKYAASLR